MTAYTALKHFHLLTVAISITLFVLRFWQWRRSPIMGRRWVKVAPHLNDTLLFVSGIALVVMFGFYPLLGMDSWLTEAVWRYYLYPAWLRRIGQEDQKSAAANRGVRAGVGLPVPDN